MNELRGLMNKGDKADVDWLVNMYDKGGETLLVSSEELKQVLDTIQAPKLRRELEILENSPAVVKSIWRWISEAWMKAFPHVDFSASQFTKPWHTLAQLQTQLRKLTLLNGIYYPLENPWEVGNVEGIVRCLIKNAPEGYKIQMQNLLAGSKSSGEIRGKNKFTSRYNY